jgi:hypothetical protein
MKNALVVFLFLSMSVGAFATDYVFGPGDEFGSLGLVNYDTLFMTGGGGHSLTLTGWSTGTIEDTDPLIGPYDGGIWHLNTSSYSELTINDGEINDVSVYGESLIYLHGGDIFESLTVHNTTAWVHIYGYGFNNNPFIGSPLTGFWADDTPFSINLVDDGISTYDQIVFHIVPEPATLLMLGLGGILVRT